MSIIQSRRQNTCQFLDWHDGISLSKILSMRCSPRNWHTSCGLWTPCARWWSAPSSLPPTQVIGLGSELGSSFLEVAEHTPNVEIRARREKEADIGGKGGLSFGVPKVGGMGTEATHAWWTPNAIAIANAGEMLCTLQSLSYVVRAKKPSASTRSVEEATPINAFKNCSPFLPPLPNPQLHHVYSASWNRYRSNLGICEWNNWGSESHVHSFQNPTPGHRMTQINPPPNKSRKIWRESEIKRQEDINGQNPTSGDFTPIRHRVTRIPRQKTDWKQCKSTSRESRSKSQEWQKWP
jgi:hypothetical protein